MSSKRKPWVNRIVGHGEEKPDQLLANPRNWRIHPQQQQAALAGVLGDIGWIAPVIVNRTTGHVVDGHLRVALAISRDEAAVPVQYVELTEAEEREALATFDPLSALAGTDADMLRDLVAEVETADAAVKGLLDELGGGGSVATGEDPGAQVDRADELREQWGVESGQLWQLGEHRLVCGDCTDAAVVKRAMDGAIPGMMVTDPPYGVCYEPEWRNTAAAAGHLSYGASAIGAVANDDRADWADAWRLFPGDVAYTWSPGGDHVLITGGALQAAGFGIRCMLVWRKAHFAISRGAYHYQHEPCWYAVRNGRKANWCGDRSQSTVWEIDHAKNETGHGTQKPLECMLRPIRNHDAPEVYDPFLGSGTTLIACERLDRRCYAIEIEPKYVAVTLQRWADMTGGTPKVLDAA